MEGGVVDVVGGLGWREGGSEGGGKESWDVLIKLGTKERMDWG